MSDSIAIALVVDSSLALASEWQQVLSEYISPILQRLRELYGVRPQNASTPPKLQFLVARVTYSTSDTYPTPLVAKIPFGPAPLVLKEIASPANMGLGLTKGFNGMAALEGLVAAIEVNASCSPVIPSANLVSSYLMPSEVPLKCVILVHDHRHPIHHEVCFRRKHHT